MLKNSVGRYLWMLLVVLAVLAAGQTRFIARDEGFYLFSAKLIAQGEMPYRDFFLPQAPLMPYLYALLFKLFGSTWQVARFFSSVTAIGCVWFLYLLARNIYGEKTARVCVLLLTCSAVFQLWIPLAKNAGLGLLFLSIALYLFLVRRDFFLAGVCIGLCALTRFTFAPLTILFLFPLSRVDCWRQVRAVVLGLVPAALVVAIFLYLAPQNFIEDNFTYHTQRTRLDEEGIEDNKRYVLMALMGLRDCIGGGGFQFCTILLGALGSVWSVVGRRKEHVFLLACAGSLFALNFIPSPTYVQYFAVVAALAAAPAAHSLLHALEWTGTRLAQRVSPRVAKGSLAILCGLCFCLFGAQDFKRFLVTGEKVIGVGAPNHSSWRIEAVSRAARRIDELNISHKPVYVSWPGYLLEASSKALPGTENNFGVGWANARKFSEAEELSRRVLSRRGIIRAFASGEIDVVVLFLGRGRSTELEKAIRELGAKKVDTIGGISFFARPQP